MPDISLGSSPGLVILRWRCSEEGLFLLARGQSEELRLRCECGRCHWIVREQFGSAGPRLLTTCHNCGRRQVFVLESVQAPVA
ncbi:MAG TPA: hypothetical protein VIB49_05995 [Thermoplasmata archaeon]